MQKKNIVRLAQLALLSAIVWLMAFTPIGYLKTAGLEITFIMIPVIIGAIVLGPADGAILGLEWGATSFIQCFGISAFGTTLFSLNPVWTFIVCVVPRVLAGWIPGLMFRALQPHDRTAGQVASCVGSALVGTLSNTVFFMSLLMLIFGQSDLIASLQQQLNTPNAFLFVLAFVGINGVVEIVTASIVAPAVAIAVRRALRHLE